MLRCGFYEKEITPPLGIDIPGYGVRRPATGVKSKLYVKAAAIEAGSKCVIVITLDAIGTHKYVHDKAVEIIAERTGVPSDCVLVHATHIHTGGSTGFESDGKYPNPHVTQDEDYVKMVARLAGDCGVLAYQRLGESTAKFAKGNLEGVSFIRNYVMKDGSIRTNPGFQNPDIVKPFGKLDTEVPVMFFFDEDKNPKGAIVNFTLHHDCVTGTEYCSDYSGVLAEDMKAQFGNDFITVFVNGTCGNVNHFDVSVSSEEFFSKLPYIGIGHKLADKVLELYEEAEDFAIDVVDGKKDTVELTRRAFSDEEIAEHEHIMKTIPIEGLRFSISEPDAPEYKRFKAEARLNFALRPKIQPTLVQAIRIGQCMIYALPGEVYCEFGMLMKELSPLKYNMAAELANGTFNCYVPTPESFIPTIYESQLPSSEFVPESGEKMARFAVELGKKLV